MMRLFLAPLFALLAAFPPPPVNMPVAGNTIPDGITVRGFGNANAMADEATISLHVASRNNALVISETTLQPVIDALVRAGVARSDITTPVYLTGATQTNNATVTAVVHHPTVAMLESGLATLSGSFVPSSPVFVTNAEIRISNANCSGTRKEAQEEAIRQARANAQSAAHDLGVRVGPVLAVDIQTNAFTTDGSCFFNYVLGPYQSSVFNTPEDYLKVRVSSSVSIRYAIR